MMSFMGWMAVVIFIPVFAPSLQVLAFGEAFCGISWGVFQVGSPFPECRLRFPANSPYRPYRLPMLPRWFRLFSDRT